MRITRSGTNPATRGNAGWFTGTVRFAPDERHWHGAGADTAMSHIAIQESMEGSEVTWLEPVSDADYRR